MNRVLPASPALIAARLIRLGWKPEPNMQAAIFQPDAPVIADADGDDVLSDPRHVFHALITDGSIRSGRDRIDAAVGIDADAGLCPALVTVR